MQCENSFCCCSCAALQPHETRYLKLSVRAVCVACIQSHLFCVVLALELIPTRPPVPSTVELYPFEPACINIVHCTPAQEMGTVTLCHNSRRLCGRAALHKICSMLFQGPMLLIGVGFTA